MRVMDPRQHQHPSRRRHPVRRLHRDESGVVLSWFAKLAVGFAVAGIALFDAGAIVVNFFTLDSTADEIAVTLTTGVTQLNPRTLANDAETLADEAGAELVDVRVEDRVVFVTLRRTAETVVVGKISWTKDWAESTAQGQAGVI